MADEKLLHAEDVIFNKPSLKELVRLIKNGTINAIWPSTKDEFDDWNNEDNPEGYTKYVDESIGRTADRLKLKSLNTSMTIYYGDHQDSTATGDIDINKTQENYNQIINAIDNQKQEITNLNYYDSINDVYPINNKNLSLSLNTEDGQINNAQNVIDYKNTILEEYKKNIEKINDFINRINNFKPNIETTSLTLSDEDLINDYNEFFINSTNEINENFRNTIALPEWDAREDVETTLIDPATSIYDFSKINELYESKNEQISDITKMLQPFYENNFFTFDNSFDSKLYQLSLEYQLIQSQLKNDINSFYTDWRQEISSAQELYHMINMLKIFTIDISQEKQQEYLNNINLLYDEYITPYETLIKKTYQLQNFGLKTTEEIEEYYINWLNTVKAAENNSNDFESKANAINDFINTINYNIFNMQLLDQQEQNDVEIFYIKNGIKDSNIIRKNLENHYNILIILEDILSNYDHLLPSNYLPRTPIDLSNFNKKLQNINIKFNNLLTIDNETNKSKINSDQDNIIYLYNKYQLEYYNFIEKLQTLNIAAVDTKTFILAEDGIANLEDIKASINNQTEKVYAHYNVLANILGYNMEESISNLNTESQNILTRVNNTIIISTDSGNEQDFIDQVINPDKTTTEDDYTITAINLLLKRIANNELSFSEEQIIPKISEDFLTIYNKDTVINNLYAILNKGESLNREYTLSSKIDNINSLLESWRPFYNSQVYSHYTCIAVGSDIKFPNNKTNENKTAMSGELIDGTTTVLLDDQFYHYPQINNLADTITTNTRNTQVLTVGGLASLFGGSGNLTDRNVGNTYIPMYISKGVFTPCDGVVSGNYITTQKGGTTYWDIVKYNGSSAVQVGLQAKKLFGAVYNDYAEYRSAEANPGRCIIENGDGTLSLSSGRLQLGANIVSDTYGFAIGETNEATCPVAVCGRVLVYPLESKEFYHPGAAVCSGPEGTVSLMTREEIREWPDAIIGYVSEVPTYDTWGSDNIPVNGRIWIKIK